MGDFYRKYRRLFFGLVVANALIGVLQLVFAYGHYVKHEWFWLVVSVGFTGINSWCAVDMYKNWRRVVNEEKEFMWRTLSSETVR